MNAGKYLKPTNSFVRFLLVGFVNTFVGLFIMFSLLNIAHLSYWTSTFAGNAAGASVSYLLNRSYTFNSKVSYQRGLPRFVLIILFCYFSAYFCSERLVDWVSHSFPLSASITENASILLGSALYTISNYFGQKYLVFKKLKEFSY